MFKESNVWVIELVLVLPDRETLFYELNDYNDSRLAQSKGMYNPYIIVDDDTAAITIEDKDENIVASISGNIINPPEDMTFKVTNYFDKTASLNTTDFLKYLCVKYGGTFQGVCFINDRFSIIHITNGSVLPLKVVLSANGGD